MNEQTKQQIMRNRELLKGYGAWDAGEEETDQEQGLAPAPVTRTSCAGRSIVGLPKGLLHPEGSPGKDFTEVIRNRRSVRSYDQAGITLEELSYLLWASQGIREMADRNVKITFRNVPSAGARHPLETYLFANKVSGLGKGIYHYLPLNHSLELFDDRGDYDGELLEAVCGQKFAARSPVLFAWSAVPYRTEWRYGLKAAKYILLDAGHACENLCLSAEAVGLGCCPIGAYDQECMDELLGFGPGPSAEPDYECTVYLAAVGRPCKKG